MHCFFHPHLMPRKGNRLKKSTVANDAVFKVYALLPQDPDCANCIFITLFPFQPSHAKDAKRTFGYAGCFGMSTIARDEKLDVNCRRNQRMHLIRGTTATLRSAPEIIAKQMQRIRTVPNLLIMSRVFEPGEVQIVAAETDDNF